MSPTHTHAYLYFTRGSVNRHLGCFYLLPVVKNSARTSAVVSESLLLILLGVYLGVRLLGPMVILCLVFLRNSQTVFLELFLRSVKLVTGVQRWGVGSNTRKWSEGEEDGPQEHSRSPSEWLDHAQSWLC